MPEIAVPVGRTGRPQRRGPGTSRTGRQPCGRARSSRRGVVRAGRFSKEGSGSPRGRPHGGLGFLVFRDQNRTDLRRVGGALVRLVQFGSPVGGVRAKGMCADAPAYAAPERENDTRRRLTLWPSGVAHLPSFVSCRAATSHVSAARQPVAHERLGPWRERPPSPRARYGLGTRWKLTPRPSPPGVAPAPSIPAGRPSRRRCETAADQPIFLRLPPLPKRLARFLLPAWERGVGGLGHHDPRLPLPNARRLGFAAGPWRPPQLRGAVTLKSASQ